MRKLSDMYGEYQDPRDLVKAIADNGIVHTTEDLKSLSKLISEIVPENFESSPAYFESFPAFTGLFIAKEISHMSRDPGAVKAVLYNYVLNSINAYEGEPSRCPDLYIFQAIYGPFEDVLLRVNDCPVYAKWRYSVGR